MRTYPLPFPPWGEGFLLFPLFTAFVFIRIQDVTELDAKYAHLPIERLGIDTPVSEQLIALFLVPALHCIARDGGRVTECR